jgi:hypothetical protein
MPSAITKPSATELTLVEPIDWLSEPERVARERVAKDEADELLHSFATHPQGKEITTPNTNQHGAGETQYLEGGQVITWINDRCHYTTDGPPDIFSSMHMTQKVCKDPPRDTSVSIR